MQIEKFYFKKINNKIYFLNAKAKKINTNFFKVNFENFKNLENKFYFLKLIIKKINYSLYKSIKLKI